MFWEFTHMKYKEFVNFIAVQLERGPGRPSLQVLKKRNQQNSYISIKNGLHGASTAAPKGLKKEANDKNQFNNKKSHALDLFDKLKVSLESSWQLEVTKQKMQPTSGVSVTTNQDIFTLFLPTLVKFSLPNLDTSKNLTLLENARFPIVV